MNEPIKNEYNEVVVVVDYGFEKLRIKSQYSNPKISKHGGGGGGCLNALKKLRQK